MVFVCVFYASDVAGLQRKDGSFAGDKWGDCDTRCLYSLID